MSELRGSLTCLPLYFPKNTSSLIVTSLNQTVYKTMNTVGPKTMLLQLAKRRIGVPRLPIFPRHVQPPHRNLIPAPGQNSGPLLERRSDRELPSVNSNRKWMRTFPIFVVVVGAAMLAIFNYQKSSSSVVSSTLYALRTSPRAREILGEEIYFANKIPWVRGEMNQLHGRIDISFWVKGTKTQGKMRFRSIRPDRMSYVR